MDKLKELHDKLDAKRAELAKIFEEAGADLDLSKVKSFDFESKDPAARRLEVKKRNDEMTEISKEIEEVQELKAAHDSTQRAGDYLKSAANRPPLQSEDSNTPAAKVKDIGTILRESKAYEAFRERGGGTAVLELSPNEAKTLLTLGDINNQATRRVGIVSPGEEERTVRDLMLPGTTDNNTLTYMEETTTTNAAATVAEGAAKPESALDFTERTDNVRKIATWIPATSELLADVAGIESYIRERLGYFIRRVEEAQLLTGDGTAPNISGILDRTGIQTYALGTDAVGEPALDAIFRGMQLVRNVGFAEPTAVVMNPDDWTPIRLLRTADGVYIWGNPSEAGPERIFGLEMRQTSAMTENTALVGAFRPHAQVFQREGITITISTEHASYFVENKVAILAEERLALAVYRPSAFCTVTGI